MLVQQLQNWYKRQLTNISATATLSKKKKKSADTHVDATATDLVERSADTGCCNRYRLIKMGQLTC